MMRTLTKFTFVAMFLLVPWLANATIVRFSTSLGTIDVNLYDELTPETVNNFLSYVDTGSYDNTIIHRSVNGFIVQGGGTTYDGTLPLGEVVSGSAITNEPQYSNVRGTIAMAKIAGNPHSATNQWFFNLADNSASLDAENGGFTVFGEVIMDDMDTVDAISILEAFNFGGVLESVPLRNYTTEDAANQVVPNEHNFVLVTSVSVIDSSTVALAGTLRKPNIADISSRKSNALIEEDSNPSSSGGGAGGLVFLGIFSLLFARRVFV